MKPQAQAIEDLVESFRVDLQRIITQARGDVVRALADRLTVADGKITKSKTNIRLLQSVDALFKRAMSRAGYQRAVIQYVRQFPGQLPYFQQTLDALGKQIGRDLTIDFGKRDKAIFVQQQVSSVRLIDAVVSTVASSAERQAMLSVGGMRLGQLIDAIVQKLDTTVPQAMGLADTALSTYYRTIADRGYRIVERDLPASAALRYKYGGPDDRLTRPFCHKMLMLTREGVTWTRKELEGMSNGQIGNVMTCAGGFNCRHQILAAGLSGGSK